MLQSKAMHTLPVLFFLSLFSIPAFATFYSSNFQTGDLHPGMNTYEVSIDPIIYLGGANTQGFGVASHVLFPISEDFSGNISAGTGAIPFHLDSHVQYSMFPDYDNQVAFSIGGGLAYLRQEQFNHVIIYSYPIVSKTFHVEGFVLTPYALAPIGMSFYQDRIGVPLKISVGAKATNPELKTVFFYLEASVGILKSPHIVSFGMAFQFDSGGG